MKSRALYMCLLVLVPVCAGAAEPLSMAKDLLNKLQVREFWRAEVHMAMQSFMPQISSEKREEAAARSESLLKELARDQFEITAEYEVDQFTQGELAELLDFADLSYARWMLVNAIDPQAAGPRPAISDEEAQIVKRITKLGLVERLTKNLTNGEADNLLLERVIDQIKVDYVKY